MTKRVLKQELVTRITCQVCWPKYWIHLALLCKACMSVDDCAKSAQECLRQSCCATMTKADGKQVTASVITFC